VRATAPLPADHVDRVEHCLPAENLYAALRRLRPLLDGPGVLVANDLLELAAVSAFPVERTVFSILHGDLDYYYDLAVRHDEDVDVFITYSNLIHRRLLDRLPHRRDTILHVRTGVRIGAQRVAAAGPLRVLFSGRIEGGQKGVFDLPVIAARLRDLGAAVTWTIQGDGPDLAALRAAWPDPDVRWTGRRSMEEAVAELPRHDVYVMPSRWEGLPSALLEAGAAGLVPVVSAVSGLDEVVIDGETGFCCAPGDTQAFAAAVARLAADPILVDRLGAASRARIRTHWDIERNALEFHRHFAQWREWRQPQRRVSKVPYGSRLDQRWLPNALVKAVRRFTWQRPA
jgi:glycosyltransferase involved in cell wall biosynthesis